MNSHLTLLANNSPLALKDDFSISIELSNPLFNDSVMFSYPASVPIQGNRQFLKNIDDRESDIRAIAYEHTPMSIIVDGTPFASGSAVIQEDEIINDSLSVNIGDSKVSFRDLISDMRCRDVKVKDDIIIGYKLSKIKVTARCNVSVVQNVIWWMPQTPTYDPSQHAGMKGTVEDIISAALSGEYDPQALGFSVPDPITMTYTDRTYSDGSTIKVPTAQRGYINTSAPYLEPDKRKRPATYCNARVCYKHYAKNAEGKTADWLIDKTDSTNLYEDIYPYWVLDADRPQSGICFYVLYFLECLFQYLGYSYNISELLAVEDLRRLHFFTTRCKYDLHESDEKNAQRINSIEEMNAWLERLGCGGQLEISTPQDAKMINTVTLNGVTRHVGDKYQYKGDAVADSYYTIQIESIETRTEIVDGSLQASAMVLPMYANSENFPDMSVPELLESLENQFGIKFIVDENRHHIDAILIRSVFRASQAPRKLYSNVLSFEKVTEKITGVKVGYKDEADTKEQQENIKNGVKDYDTSYDYCEYPQNRTVQGRNLYSTIFRAPSNNDMHVYIDVSTGNKYRIKVDSEANQVRDLRPVIFEVGQYHHVELGDCSSTNEDNIVDIRSSLQPVTLIDVNYGNEVATVGGSYSDVKIISKDINGTISTVQADFSATAIPTDPILVPFCDEDMEHEFVEQRINNVISEGLADAYITTILKTQESYDPSKTDDGNSPLQSYDWGNAICIMRGGGDKDGIITYDRNYDGFNNSKWRGSVSNYQISSDNITQFGEGYDYAGEQFSLKPRAWVQPEWAKDPIVVNDPLIKNRGYFDTFLTDYAYFLLNRKTYRVRCLATVAQIADIPNHWKEWWVIDNRKCLINKVNTDISVRDGIGEVELEVYSL